jgi:hypothetical protein
MRRSLLAIIPLFAAAPALAVSGVDAANLCLRQSEACTVSVGSQGELAIVARGIAIWCPSNEADCAVVHRPAGWRTEFRRYNAVLAAREVLSGR